MSLSEALSLSDDARIVTAATPPYTIVHTNTAWSKITGYKFHEVVGKTPAFLQGPATELPALKELHAAMLANAQRQQAADAQPTGGRKGFGGTQLAGEATYEAFKGKRVITAAGRRLE